MAEIKTQPSYKRQRFLLGFIQQLQKGATATDLQKLVFLYTMKEKSDTYEFMPYKYGSYSFQLAEDIEILNRDGYLTTDASRIKAVDIYKFGPLYPIASERGNSLIRKAYREYPYYTKNSEILDRLFDAEEAQRIRRTREKYVQHEQILFTIGYEGKSVEAFINTLIQNDVRLLVDVRKNPLSRKFGFSNKKLEHILETAGIKYVHTPDLGIESGKRNSLNTMDDYRHLFEGYKKSLSSCTREVERVYSLLNANVRIALMCYEKEPEMCHRHVLKEYMDETYEMRSADL